MEIPPPSNPQLTCFKQSRKWEEGKKNTILLFLEGAWDAIYFASSWPGVVEGCCLDIISGTWRLKILPPNISYHALVWTTSSSRTMTSNDNCGMDIAKGTHLGLNSL